MARAGSFVKGRSFGRAGSKPAPYDKMSESFFKGKLRGIPARRPDDKKKRGKIPLLLREKILDFSKFDSPDEEGGGEEIDETGAKSMTE